jgi:hypothetical protein
MINLKSYKLFEMKIYEDELPEVDKYLSILGTDREDINDKFIDLIDDGYEIYYILRFIGADGKGRKTKRTNKEIPVLQIDVTENNSAFDGKKLKSPEFIQTIHDCIKGFYNMVSDKCEINLEISGGLNIELECIFPAEEDSNKVSISPDELETISFKVMNELAPDDYYCSKSEEGFSADVKIEMKPNDIAAKCKQLVDSYKKGDDTFLTNYNELDEIKDKILIRLEEELSKKVGKKITYSKNNYDRFFCYDSNGEKIKFIDVVCYTDEIPLRQSKFKKKMGFFNRDVVIEFEIAKIKLDLRIR